MKRVLLLSLILFSLFSVTVSAQEEGNGSNGGLIVSPALIDKDDVIPGDTLNFDVKVTNLDPMNRTVYLGVESFESDPNEGGNPTFSNEPNERSIVDWIFFNQESIDLKPNERVAVPVTIQVPEDAQAGSHYGAITFGDENPNTPQKTGVGAQYEVTLIVLLNVAGEAIEDGRVLDFSVSQDWYQYPPVTFSTRFENTGNVHTKPTGLIEVYNAAGKKEAVMQINEAFGNVLPGSVRKFNNEWDPKPWLGFIPRIGKYRAEGLLTYGLPSTTVDMGAVEFWLIPIPFILKVLAVVVAIVLVIALLLRAYARRVEKGYEQKTKNKPPRKRTYKNKKRK